MESALKNQQDLNILITDVGSYLGSELAKSQIATGAKVYGVGSSPLLSELLQSHNFTLLELDLSQPLPAYLPKFQKIFYLNFLKDPNMIFSHIPPPLKNLHNLCLTEETPLYIIAPISVDPEILMSLLGSAHEKLTKLIQVGDVYGPNLPLGHTPANELENLIGQAITTDKIIMEDEGLRIVYPAYIDDVVLAITKFAYSHDSPKLTQIISEEPKTALSVAYEIQNAASLILGKNLGLFFSGPEPQNKPQKPHYVHAASTGFSSRVELKEGIKLIFQKYIEKEPPRKKEEAPKINQILERHLQVPTVSGTSRWTRFTTKLEGLKFKPKLKYRYFALALILLLTVTISKTTIDIVLGARSLTQAKDALYKGNLPIAIKKGDSAQSSFNAAENKIRILMFPFLTLNIRFAENLYEIANSSEQSSLAFSYFLKGAESLAIDLKQVTSKDQRQEESKNNSAINDFKKAYFLSSLAGQKLEGNNSILVRKTKVKENIALLKSGSLYAYEFAKLYPKIIGSEDPKTYLILLQNNTELRPGGGFIGNYALVEFEKGKLKEIIVDDVYNIDGQLKEEIEPPPQLKEKLGIERFYLRDSNWNLDFNLNSQTARDFFKKETGKDVQGVIAFDLTFMQSLLEKLGPIKLEDYQEEITADNLFERGEYYSEVGFFPGSTQKRDFFGALARRLIGQMVSSLNGENSTDQKAWFAFFQTVMEKLNSKHFLVSFDDPTLASFIRTKGWDNPLPPITFDLSNEINETKDFIALSEANIGANKVNRFLKREITYEMTIGRDADLVATLKINFSNNSQAETWPGGKYVNYLRVYLPQQAELTSVKNGDITDIASVETKKMGNLTELSTMIEVPIKSSKEVIFNYRIHKNINLEKAPVYHLYVQKQPGTENDPFRFTFNLPAYLKIKSVNGDIDEEGKENLSLQNNLTTDKSYLIEIEKK